MAFGIVTFLLILGLMALKSTAEFVNNCEAGY
jgi:hypothetical protein